MVRVSAYTAGVDIPADLIELQRARLDAERAYGDYVHEVEARRREQHPDDIVARRTWDDGERAEEARLRGLMLAALDAVRTHPALVGGSDRHKTEQGALQAAKELVAGG